MITFIPFSFTLSLMCVYWCVLGNVSGTVLRGIQDQTNSENPPINPNPNVPSTIQGYNHAIMQCSASSTSTPLPQIFLDLEHNSGDHDEVCEVDDFLMTQYTIFSISANTPHHHNHTH